MEEASDNRNKDTSKRARTHEKEYVERDSKLACSGTSTVPKMVAFENKKGDHIGLHFLSAQNLKSQIILISKVGEVRLVNPFLDAVEKYDNALQRTE